MRTDGLTLLELIVVVAIIGIVAGIGVINGNRIARQERAHAAVATLQQSVWQGATSAASRGREIDLHFDGQNLGLVDVTDDSLVRTFELPEGTRTNMSPGTVLKFLPPGKVDLELLSDLNNADGGYGLLIDTGQNTYNLEISIIGEVRLKGEE